MSRCIEQDIDTETGAEVQGPACLPIGWARLRGECWHCRCGCITKAMAAESRMESRQGTGSHGVEVAGKVCCGGPTRMPRSFGALLSSLTLQKLRKKSCRKLPNESLHETRCSNMRFNSVWKMIMLTAALPCGLSAIFPFVRRCPCQTSRGLRKPASRVRLCSRPSMFLKS